jgi:hypothetical protein
MHIRVNIALDEGGVVALATEVARRERVDRGALEHLSVAGEAGAVAGTVPGALGIVPSDDATEVCAASRDRMQGAVLVAAHCDLAPAV